jgi:formylglycine-generating enzyme required for sulfatase activity
MRSNRRAFLQGLAGGALAATVPGTASPQPVADLAGGGRLAAPGLLRDSSFRGGRAGEERVVGGIRFCWCPPGRFVMGSPPTERGHRPDEAQADVVLTTGFWAAKHEATQGQWRRIIGPFPDRPPSVAFGEGDEFPVYWINFDEAEAFCSELTRRLQESGALPAGWEFRLPTEAQWEYACRSGTSTATAHGDTLGPHQANFDSDTDDRGARPRGARSVGSYPASPWGLQDMHGNVWEWCRDYYHPRLPGGTDPDLHGSKGIPNRDGTYSRVRRGGAWIEPAWACRSACRLRYEPHRRSDHIGFRVVAVER